MEKSKINHFSKNHLLFLPLPPRLISIYHPQLIRNSTADGHRWTQIKLNIRPRKNYDRKVEEWKIRNSIFQRISSSSSSSSSSSAPHFNLSSPVHKKFLLLTSILTPSLIFEKKPEPVSNLTTDQAHFQLHS